VHCGEASVGSRSKNKLKKIMGLQRDEGKDAAGGEFQEKILLGYEKISNFELGMEKVYPIRETKIRWGGQAMINGAVGSV